MVTTVRDILRRKGNEVISVSRDVPVYEALSLMKKKGIGALIVTNRKGKAVGIVSDRDCTQKIVLDDKPARSTTVSKIMSTGLISTTPEKSSEECIAVMLEEGIRHLPVLDGGKMAGLISIGDAVKSIVKKQRVEIKQLSNYIAGSYM
jgi:CBS domain-containing protein